MKADIEGKLLFENFMIYIIHFLFKGGWLVKNIVKLYTWLIHFSVFFLECYWYILIDPFIQHFDLIREVCVIIPQALYLVYLYLVPRVMVIAWVA